MYFDETNNYYENNYDNITVTRDKKLYSSKEGFNKGNMFPDIYSKYKNHTYKLIVNNQKDELLYKIQMYTFTLIDYNLYLDIYPDDTDILREFRDVKTELEELKTSYESKYGPLCTNSVESSSKWTWLNNPWPWDKGGNK